MKLDPQTRDILRQYETLINARRRHSGQRELTTAHVVDEICYYMTCQCSVYIGGHFIQQGVKEQLRYGRRLCRLPASAKTQAGRMPACDWPAPAVQVWSASTVCSSICCRGLYVTQSRFNTV